MVAVSLFDEYLLALLTLTMIVCGVVLYFYPVGYGKFVNEQNSISISFLSVLAQPVDGKLGFAIQECPSAILPVLVYAYYCSEAQWHHALFLLLWELHYVHR